MNSRELMPSFPLALYLEGFQSIADFTKIEFAPLTLLYGPNSAGKSSVVDALNLAIKLFNHPILIRGEVVDQVNFGIDESKFGRLYNSDIQKHWRQTGPKNDINSYHPTMSVGVNLNLTKNDTCTIVSTFHSLSEIGPEYNANFGCLRDFVIKINETVLFDIKEYNRFTFNYSHPYIIENYNELYQSVSSYDFENFSALKTENGNLIYSNKNDESCIYIDGLKKIDMKTFFSQRAQDRNDTSNIVSKYELELLDPIVSLYNRLICEIIPNIESPDLVSASRNTPNTKDLTIYVPPGGRYQEIESNDIDSIKPIRPLHMPSEDSEYFELALSFAEKLPNYCSESLLEGDTPLHIKINNSLVNELFTDKAYQLHSICSINISYNNYSEMIESEKNYDFHEQYLENHGVFVRILLKDMNGVVLDFEDVGSGVGYVLPVLANIHSSQSPYIQQPELHLHPALQSSLADVFLNAAKDGGERHLIVETHSEHLLLRALKRVRQTESGRILDESKKVMSSDIKIYYFEPNIDGSTKVKNIRISRNGEFMDRWPQGFFEERYAELFDE